MYKTTLIDLTFWLLITFSVWVTHYNVVEDVCIVPRKQGELMYHKYIYSK